MTSLEIGATVFFGIFSRYTLPLDQMLDFMECDGICIRNIAHECCRLPFNVLYVLVDQTFTSLTDGHFT